MLRPEGDARRHIAGQEFTLSPRPRRQLDFVFIFYQFLPPSFAAKIRACRSALYELVPVKNYRYIPRRQQPNHMVHGPIPRLSTAVGAVGTGNLFFHSFIYCPPPFYLPMLLANFAPFLVHPDFQDDDGVRVRASVGSDG